MPGLDQFHLCIQNKMHLSYNKLLQFMLKFKTKEELEAFTKQSGKVLLVKDNDVLDVTTFARHHPGGQGLLLTYQNKDISEPFKLHYQLTYKMADSMIIGTFKKDLERLITPDLPLMTQIWELNHQQYLGIVESPYWLFCPSPRMFKSSFFEMLSHNLWYHVLIFHLIVYGCLASTLNFNNVYLVSALPVFLLGVFTFSLIEYLLHRFLFHSEKHLFDNKVLRYCHFVLHGIHHMLPIDPDRLVLPPALAIVFMLIGYKTIYQVVFPSNYELRIIYHIGIGAGYICYDMIHYSLHHIHSKGGYFKSLQRYHNQHHFSGEEAGYGVSSKFWDIIFRTELSTPKTQVY